MNEDRKDYLDSGRRFVLGQTLSSRLESDFFNLYAWFLRFVSGKKVLDAACGSGLGSFLMAHKAREVLAIDLSRESIDFAKLHYHLDNLQFIVSDVLNYNLPAEEFDVIICSLILEQIEISKQKAFLTRLRESLKKEGLMILVTPNKRVTSPSSVVGHQWNKKEFYQQELHEFLRQVGYKIVGWYGQRMVFKLYTNFFVRKMISLAQRLLKKKFGFYGRRESPQVSPLKFYLEPKEFVVLLTKN